ncbi:MAG: hypothetical protein ABI823_14970 [Bryobacteraceae bacterium]
MMGRNSLGEGDRTGPFVTARASVKIAFRVLLIEDRESCTVRIGDWLRGSRDPSFNLECATALTEGLLRLEGGCLDAVLVGLHLEGAPGLLSLRAARAAAPDVPVIAISGERGVAREAMSLGARDLLIRGEFNGRMLIQCLELSRARPVRCGASPLFAPGGRHERATEIGGLVWRKCEKVRDIGLVR